MFVRIRRPPRSTQSRSSAASDVYKRQLAGWLRADALDYSLEETICRATAVAVARCEVERPWNLKLDRVHQLEKELLSAIERIAD